MSKFSSFLTLAAVVFSGVSLSTALQCYSCSYTTTLVQDTSTNNPSCGTDTPDQKFLQNCSTSGFPLPDARKHVCMKTSFQGKVDGNEHSWITRSCYTLTVGLMDEDKCTTKKVKKFDNHYSLWGQIVRNFVTSWDKGELDRSTKFSGCVCPDDKCNSGLAIRTNYVLSFVLLIVGYVLKK